MTSVAMWKAPPRREYKPKPMDAGQRVTWTARTEGYYVGGYSPTAVYVPQVDVQRAGVIWSDGSAPHTWWVLPDDDPLNPVIVRRAGAKQRMQYRAGELFQSGEGNGWREAVRRAENVRARGIFPVIEHTEPGRYDYISRRNLADTHTVVWHADRACPAAEGKELFGGDQARNYRGPDYAVWTAADVARALMGLVRVGSSPTPFCARCIMLDRSLASPHSCASVTA